MPGRLALAVTLSILGALTEGLALLTLVPLLQLIGIDIHQGSFGYVARAMAAAFGWLGLPLNLFSILVLYVGLIAGDAALRRWQKVTYCSLQVGFTAHLRKRLHPVVTRASWVQLTRYGASDLTHAMTAQVERIGDTTQVVLRTAKDAMLTFVYLAVTRTCPRPSRRSWCRPASFSCSRSGARRGRRSPSARR